MNEDKIFLYNICQPAMRNNENLCKAQHECQTLNSMLLFYQDHYLNMVCAVMKASISLAQRTQTVPISTNVISKQTGYLHNETTRLVFILVAHNVADIGVKYILVTCFIDTINERKHSRHLEHSFKDPQFIHSQQVHALQAHLSCEQTGKEFSTLMNF
ncbi:CLUMA_CG019193, isoform A [Clunio marinus]|uniref:CLUMA_CG019193, isoform A n=1 Tax=Clunio marinus TaxID=568069 RepID=A0A1J1J2G2_9DIPT|nr:CLUMA_CG019193, isoform A [Clunio marinus]